MVDYFIDGHEIDTGVNSFCIDGDYITASFSNSVLNSFGEYLRGKCESGDCVDMVINHNGNKISFMAKITEIYQERVGDFTFMAQSTNEWLVTKIDELESK